MPKPVHDVIYTDHRHRFRSGDLIFWHGKGIMGWLVRWWTKSDFAHVGIVLCFGKRVMVMDARPGTGVRLAPLSKLPPFIHVPTGDRWTEHATAFALAEWGQPYSYSDAIRAGLKMGLSARGYQCAEFVSAVLAHADVAIPDRATTPQRLFHWSSNVINKYRFKVT